MTWATNEKATRSAGLAAWSILIRACSAIGRRGEMMSRSAEAQGTGELEMSLRIRDTHLRWLK